MRAGPPNLRDPWRLPFHLATVTALYFLAMLSYVVVCRVGAFVEYDWVEGATVSTVRRVLTGHGLYDPPSLEYSSFPYAPGYFYVSAVVSVVVGEGYLAARLVSTLALTGSLALIARAVALETKSTLSGIIAAGTFAWLCDLSRFAGAMARVDSLAVFLVLLAAYLLRFHETRIGLVGAILAAAAAVLTKQTAVLPVAALGAWSLLARGRRGLAFPLGAIGIAALALLAFGWHTGGWSWFYIVAMPAAHPRPSFLYARFFKDSLITGLGIGVALCGYALLPATGDDRSRRLTILFHGLLFAALGLASMLPSVKHGGNVNNLIAVCAAVSIGVGLASGKALKRGRWHAAVAGVLVLGFAIQHRYWPGKFLPSPSRETEAIVDLAAFRSMPDRIFAPFHGWLPEAAGRRPSAYWSSLVDAFMTPREQEARLRAQLQAALLEKRFAAVVHYKGGYYAIDRFPARELAIAYRPLEPGEAARRGWLEGPTMVVFVPRN